MCHYPQGLVMLVAMDIPCAWTTIETPNPLILLDQERGSWCYPSVGGILWSQPTNTLLLLHEAQFESFLDFLCTFPQVWLLCVQMGPLSQMRHSSVPGSMVCSSSVFMILDFCDKNHIPSTVNVFKGAGVPQSKQSGCCTRERSQRFSGAVLGWTCWKTNCQFLCPQPTGIGMWHLEHGLEGIGLLCFPSSSPQ